MATGAAGFPPARRLTGVPDSGLNVIILSQRSLVRELLGELLRIRCGVRNVEKLESPERARAPVRAASVVVVDPNGLHADVLDPFLERLLSENPRLRILRVDDSQADFGIEDFVTSIRGAFAHVPVVHEHLTPLEMEVMLAVAAGLRNAEIARRMRRSSKTIEKHRANLQRKLGVRTVAQLTAYAIHHGLLRADAVIEPNRQS